ncbi:MAG: CDP-diacylglycerol--serine O-phosphatidyltransferase [Ignavibacteriae bacterium]|nr:CDP-diacylglycerol--serine O-phosphatidyltransferase [Ignavibacteriota bacterium]
MVASKKFIPSLFTILNAFCGFMSAVAASNSEFNNAVYFIFFAVIFDMLDGMVARILKTSSDFGVELDSLSDVISFGFAPSFLLYNFFFKDYGEAGLAISAMIMAFSAIRLARFNVDLVGFNKDVFFGLPTPMAALTVCSYIMFVHGKMLNDETSRAFIFVVTIGISLLMVSKIRFAAIPALSMKTIKTRKLTFILIILGFILSVLTKGKAIFPISIVYILSGFIMTIADIKGRKRQPRNI